MQEPATDILAQDWPYDSVEVCAISKTWLMMMLYVAQSEPAAWKTKHGQSAFQKPKQRIGMMYASTSHVAKEA